jgi:chemotaxis signal transduction protein
MMDMVIFTLGAQHYALSAACVSQVLLPVPVTPVPYAPDFVDGLVNVNGRVVLQVDAGLRLGGRERLPAATGVIILLQQSGSETAIHVDRVLTQASVDIPPVSGTGDVANPILSEFIWREMGVFLLDGRFFGLDDLTALDVPGEGGGVLGVLNAEGRGAAFSAGLQKSQAEFMCLMIGMMDEHYALRIADIDEVVDEFSLSALPHAPQEVAGMCLLRGRATLVMSLQRILGLGGRNGASSPQSRWMVVVRHEDMRFGLLVDEVAGFAVFCQNDVQQVEQGREIAAYLHDEELGLVGLLDMRGLVAPVHQDHYRQYLARPDANHALPARSVVRRFLSFQLQAEWYVVALSSVDRIEEYLSMTRVPEASRGQYLRGVVHVHGDIVPVLDICGVESAASVHEMNRKSLLLLRNRDDALWALMVSSVHSVIEIAEEDILAVVAASHDVMESVARHEGRLYSVLSIEGVSQMLHADGCSLDGR